MEKRVIFTPVGDLMTVDVDDDSGTTATGIIVTSNQRYSTGVVRRLGPDVSMRVFLGKRVVFETAAIIEIEYLGTKFKLVRVPNVLGIFDTVTKEIENPTDAG